MRTVPEGRLDLNASGWNASSRLADRERQAATEFVDRVREQFGDQVVSVLVFGSRARGEAEPDSDMDLLVIMSDAGPEIRRAIRYLAVEVWLKYGIYLSTRVWSRAHWGKLEKLQTLLYRNICRDGISL
jgi:predicted nucleotidyltransferase